MSIFSVRAIEGQNRSEVSLLRTHNLRLCSTIMREYRLMSVSAGERYTSSMLVLSIFLTTMRTPTVQALGPWLQA